MNNHGYIDAPLGVVLEEHPDVARIVMGPGKYRTTVLWKAERLPAIRIRDQAEKAFFREFHMEFAPYVHITNIEHINPMAGEDGQMEWGFVFLFRILPSENGESASLGPAVAVWPLIPKIGLWLVAKIKAIGSRTTLLHLGYAAGAIVLTVATVRLTRIIHRGGKLIEERVEEAVDVVFRGFEIVVFGAVAFALWILFRGDVRESLRRRRHARERKAKKRKDHLDLRTKEGRKAKRVEELRKMLEALD